MSHDKKYLSSKESALSTFCQQYEPCLFVPIYPIRNWSGNKFPPNTMSQMQYLLPEQLPQSKISGITNPAHIYNNVASHILRCRFKQLLIPIQFTILAC